MKKLFALPLAGAIALGAACADMDAFTAPDDLNIGVSSPGTSVDATAQITGPEETITSYLSGPLPETSGHRNRSCSGNGVYSWTTGPAGNPTNHVSGENHATCTTTTTIPGYTINIEFVTVANYVRPPSGNIHLNFSMCGYTEVEVAADVWEWQQSPCTSPTFIHHKRNGGMIDATGVLSGYDTNGDVWTIDLDQVNATAGPSGLAPATKSFTLVAVGPGGVKAQATLSWE